MASWPYSCLLPVIGYQHRLVLATKFRSVARKLAYLAVTRVRLLIARAHALRAASNTDGINNLLEDSMDPPGIAKFACELSFPAKRAEHRAADQRLSKGGAATSVLCRS